ncbi:5-deoxy-glucuronate isomerase [Eubacterium sp.]
MKMDIEYSIKKINMNEGFSLSFSNMETVIVIISGKYKVCFDEQKDGISGERKSVFDSAAHVIYVPRECEARIQAESHELVVVIASTYAEKKLKPFVKREGFKKEIRGKKEYKRTVIDLLNEDDDTESVFVGETFHTNGVWSGYPPHKHDVEIKGKESKNEELYFVKVEPSNGFGIFVKYTDKTHKDAFVVNDETFIYVKEGYHAILSAPEYNFYYLWIASSIDKKFICASDDDFSWIEER